MGEPDGDMPGIAPVLGIWFVKGMAPGWTLVAAVVAGGMTIGLPGTAAGIGSPGCVCATVAGAAAELSDACRLELSETKVAQPSTSAIAPPAARPTLSRRVLRVATIGNAL